MWEPTLLPRTGRIYDGIFFFTNASTLQLSDEKLIAELKKDNPDWFE
jgi:hypothetical protein